MMNIKKFLLLVSSLFIISSCTFSNTGQNENEKSILQSRIDDGYFDKFSDGYYVFMITVVLTKQKTAEYKKISLNDFPNIDINRVAESYSYYEDSSIESSLRRHIFIYPSNHELSNAVNIFASLATIDFVYDAFIEEPGVSGVS